MTGGSLWSFKSNCMGDNCYVNAWVLFSAASGPPSGPIPPNGAPVEPRRALVSRTHARAVVGEALSYSFDNVTLAFVLAANASTPSAAEATGTGAPYASQSALGPRISRVSAAEYEPAMFRRRRGAGGAPLTEIFVPATLAQLNVSVTGAATLIEVVSWPDDSRTAFVAPSGGLYTVVVAATADEAAQLASDALRRHTGPAVAAAAAEAKVAASNALAGRAQALAALDARFETARSAALLAGVEL
jgi:hypothetical protein